MSSNSGKKKTIIVCDGWPGETQGTCWGRVTQYYTGMTFQQRTRRAWIFFPEQNNLYPWLTTSPEFNCVCRNHNLNHFHFHWTSGIPSPFPHLRAIQLDKSKKGEVWVQCWLRDCASPIRRIWRLETFLQNEVLIPLTWFSSKVIEEDWIESSRCDELKRQGLLSDNIKHTQTPFSSHSETVYYSGHECSRIGKSKVQFQC